ncbi:MULTISPECIES: GNAT family N-acetyltransferase [unclassified Streptomyces]|uniref:GNAT family N-acetyltransferase n=1 Tax=unclassified Streptomyces TaxID=2593676 RepID=UPI00202DE4D3|nr:MULTISPECIES: GNAT family N-acetyltransferase [unclassified Streptomyces]MCM1969894.1 GNAT family N-acetyltransferase [Streptomyces sp. G1]
MTLVNRHGTAPPLPELRADGLLLRPWDPESETDVEAWLRGRTDPEFTRWNTPLRFTADRDTARDQLRAAVQNAAEGAAAPYCVADPRTRQPLGHIGVNVINRVMNTARVGYWVLPEARGHGIATRALAVTARWVFTDLGLHRLELDHAVGHDASCRIAERCGFRYEGTLRGAMWEAGRHDAYRDMHLHARLAGDPDPGPVARR